MAGDERLPRRRGSRRPLPEQPPLGSLTQSGTDHPVGTAVCARCGSTRLTRLGLTLASGTKVTFVSCHECEHRVWVPVDGVGSPLSREEVVRLSSRP